MLGFREVHLPVDFLNQVNGKTKNTIYLQWLTYLFTAISWIKQQVNCKNVTAKKLWFTQLQEKAATGTYVKDVFLNDGVHDDGHQHVEEDSSYIFQTVVEIIHSRFLRTS